jgi:hypothetical protein
VSDLLERVAEAILDAVGDRALGDLDDLTDVLIDGQIDLIAVARAVVEEMRDPTPEMIAACGEALSEWRKTLTRDEAVSRFYRPSGERRFIASATPEEKHAIRWRAMIDAALAP